jgi:hypothetical protein
MLYFLPKNQARPHNPTFLGAAPNMSLSDKFAGFSSTTFMEEEVCELLDQIREAIDGGG